MTKSPYLSTLTPLRGIAALLVVVFHITCYLVPLTAPGQTELISMGWLWVDFFFILSGFILCHVYSDFFKNGVSRTEYRRFILARFARVYPLHLVTLGLAVLLIVVINFLAQGVMATLKWSFDLKTIPASLVLLQSMGLYPAAPLNGPSWSLSTEWWVYLVFPFLVSPLMHLKPWSKAGIFLLVVASYLVLTYWVAPHWGNRFTAELGFPIKPTLNLTADFGFFVAWPVSCWECFATKHTVSRRVFLY
jgi:peptidoglycan/LPS O-acetylase OafA/YrhL